MIPAAQPLTVAVRCHTEPGPGVCRHCWEPTGDPERELCERCAKPSRPPDDWRPELMLAFDCETTVDYAQALTFGFARLYRIIWRRRSVEPRCIGEFCFHADELPQTDPEGYETLKAHCGGRLPALDEPLDPFPQALLWLMPRSEFVKLFYDYAYKQRAMVVGFNLPFDISRLAVKWGAVRGRGSFYGGFRFTLSEVPSKKTGGPREALWRPPIAVNPIDSRRALIGFLAPGGPRVAKLTLGFEHHSGQFLDLHTLVRALTDESHSLKSAGETFKAKIIKAESEEHGKITPKYIEYARRDTAATASLFEAAMADYLQDPIDLQPTRAFSAASRGKAHLDAMGIRPVLERQPDFPRDVLGHWMTGYLGGRAQAHIRRVPAPGVPVQYLDFLSMYPTVCALMDLWHVMTAAKLELVEEDPARLRVWIEQLTLDNLFDPRIWPQLRVLVQIKPNADVLPVRAAYGAARDFNIGVNYYTSDEPQWFSLPDVINSKLITRRAPEVVRAIRVGPVGRQRGMRAITLRGGIQVDPYSDDFFRVLVEQRNRRPNKNDSTGRGLKTLANGTSYGIWAEMNRVEQPGRRKLPVVVHGHRTFACETAHPEKPGPYYFPPIAALIASGARLMLGMLETHATRAGGTYAFCDTDSSAIVSSEHGGSLDYTDHTGARRTIPVLSWDQVDEIVGRFEALNPYDREVVPGSILKTEEVNFDSAGNRRQLWTFPISAKRYPLYTLTQGHPALARVIDLDDDEDADIPDESAQLDQLADAKQHGLGHLCNPLNPDDQSRSWIDESGGIWDHIVRTDALGQQADEPYWLDRPAVGRFNVSTPRLSRAFNRFNHGKPHWRQVRPFNFMLVAHSGALDRGQLTSRFLLVTRYEKDPSKWTRLRWINVYDPSHSYNIRSGKAHSTPGSTTVVVKTYRDVLADYRVHPEAKSLGPDGEPCDKQTVGLLSRRHVTPILPLRHRGKEGQWIDQREAGVGDPDTTHTEYREPGQDPLSQLTVPTLRKLAGELKPGAAQIAAGAGVSQHTVERAVVGKLTGTTTRAREARAKLTAFAIRHARAQLRAHGTRPPADPEALLATYLKQQRAPGPEPRLCACGCGQPVPAATRGRPRRYIDDTHRKRAQRQSAARP
jgi:hypothetical protein